MSHTLIFDIGKTNKKVFIFNEDFEVVWQEESVFDEIEDEDGFPCDDIHQITDWIKIKWLQVIEDPNYTISKINCATYGASFVHIDGNEEIILPIYNYLKPMEVDYFQELYVAYNGSEEFARKTSSPVMSFLNAGLQLYWLKKEKQSSFKQIKYSFHFPNYISYLFHEEPCAEFTSIGCHTALWDMEKNCYHEWVVDSGIDQKLPQIYDGLTHFDHPQLDVKVGTGLHDSSAALVPYLIGVKEPFLLLSTGTWSICLNPFNEDLLTEEELKNDCLEFLQISGKKVKASRLFLGHEFNAHIKRLNKHFKEKDDAYKDILFDNKLYQSLKSKNKRFFHFPSWESNDEVNIELDQFENFEVAYFQLVLELVDRQIIAIRLALGDDATIGTIFIDGGFSKNELFTKMLSLEMPNFEFKLSSLAAGSSLGAAIAMNPSLFTEEVFDKILDINKVNI